MEDDVMAISVSACGKFIVLALLDTTVRVLHADSYKHMLSFYGHRLPVLSLDISSDSSLCVTGSADKNIKIWGMDFGDCHKSLHAHGDSVMCVKFVPNTHYCWSGGKDGVIKMWDCDKLVQVRPWNGQIRNSHGSGKIASLEHIHNSIIGTYT